MLILSCLILSIGFSIAQTTRISGVVVDDSGEAVIGASVVVKGSTTGTITDVDGNFSLNVPQGSKTLVVSLIGMQTKETAPSQNMKIVLSADTELLDEVMVVAYGTAKKESFTGSAAVISNKSIEKRIVANVSKALDGQVAGLQTTSGGGQPGDPAKVVIRGFGSINASNDPLYVVDGIPFVGSISSISPGDIESISVLKDASASALYGSRGSNGVVIITTKKGRSGKVETNYRTNIGWSSRGVKEYDTTNQKEFVQLTYEGLRNDYIYKNNYSWADAKTAAMGDLSGFLGGEAYNPFKNYTWATVIDPSTEKVRTDATAAWNESWLDEITRGSAFRQEHQINISGGSEKLSSMFSLGYLNEDGLLKTTNCERYSGRISVNAKPNEWVNAGASASFAQTKQNYAGSTGSSTGNVWYSAQFMAPIYPVYTKNLDGTDALDANGNRQFDYGVTRPKQTNFSSIGTLYDDKYYVNNDNFGLRSNITFGSDSEKAGIFKGLKLTFNLGADYKTLNQTMFYNTEHGNQAESGGLLRKFNTRTMSYTFNQLLTWDRNFDKHGIDILAGHEIYRYRYNYLEAGKTGLLPGIIELNPGTTLYSADSYTQKHLIESYLSRFNYNYDEKYYFSTSYRRDGSSRFNTKKRWGDFWSVGGNWRISQENFMKDATWVDNLSLKVSYGEQGNDNLLHAVNNVLVENYYVWQGLYGAGWNNGDIPGLLLETLESKDVSWETSKNLNLGVEGSLFNKRLNFTIEYFNKKTTDMLLDNPLPSSSGFEGFADNIGDMRNRGFEASITGTIINTENLTWQMTIQGTTVSNEVLKLTKDVPELINGVFSTKAGNEINTFYLAKSAGVDPATGAQLYWAYLNTNGDKVDDYITSDKTVAGQSKYYQGSRIPDLYGSIGSELTLFKDFDFSFLTTYSIGGKIYDSNYAGLMAPMYAGDVLSSNALRRWQKPGDITDVPRVSFSDSNLSTDKNLIDASYFAIKNITLGYTLPKQLLRSAGLSSVRIYTSLDNIALFTHLDGMDPQYNFRGSTDYTYAPNKTVSFGVDIKF